MIKDLIGLFANCWRMDRLIKLSKQGLVLPFYHVVSNQDLIHIKHLYPVVSTQRFEADLDFLLKHYKPSSYPFLLNCIEDPSLRKEKMFYLTFDDGLREFHDVVAPILLRKGIPATCFVNTGFIDNKAMFFRMKASILIETIAYKPLTKAQQNSIQQLFIKHSLSYQFAHDLLKISDKNQSILDDIANILEVSFDDYLKTHQPYLTTNQIQNLIKQGFSIGAHSVSHPYFPDLSEDQQVEQVIDSMQFLHDNFQITEKLFSFPYTDFDIGQSFFEKIRQEVDLTFGTANLKLDSIATNFQRIPMEIKNSKSASQIIKKAYALYIIKMFMNKHIIERS